MIRKKTVPLIHNFPVIDSGGQPPDPRPLQETRVKSGSGKIGFCQKIRFQMDLFRGNFLQIPSSEDILTVLECEHVIGRFIPEFFSCVGIDMAHHEVNLFLRILADINTFRDDTPDHFVVVLTGAFLEWRIRIAIEYAGSPVSL